VTIHGITHADLEQAPDLVDILPELLGCLAGRLPVVHYRDIERPFLDVALLHRLQEGIQFPLLDTMAIEAHLHPNRRPNFWQTWRGKKPLSIRLSDSRLRYGLPHYAAHNALMDAIATAELLQAQIAHHFGAQTPVSDLWL
jgi:DNA polymerase-3 subunit epsilon